MTERDGGGNQGSLGNQRGELRAFWELEPSSDAACTLITLVMSGGDTVEHSGACVQFVCCECPLEVKI